MEAAITIHSLQSSTRACPARGRFYRRRTWVQAPTTLPVPSPFCRRGGVAYVSDYVSGTGSAFAAKVSESQEIGYVDSAGDVNAVGNLGKGQTLYVRGWAVDTATGAPVTSVTVFVDGSNVGPATLGLARPDVAQGFGRSDYTNSGWSFQMSTSSLSAGLLRDFFESFVKIGRTGLS
jgi:hypothetical protein